MRKGDRVTWLDSKKRVTFGVVTKGGKNNITVRHDGGTKESIGPQHYFRHTDEPIPNAKEKNVMKRYSIKGYKEIEGHGDSITFSTKICLDGKPVFIAMNDGWGGPNMYQGTKGNIHKEAESAEILAKKWIQDATGLEDESEALDLWITWEMYERPFGVTAKESLAWLVKLQGNNKEKVNQDISTKHVHIEA